jgi:hypothetical protein
VVSSGLEVVSKWSRGVEIEALPIFALTQKHTFGMLFRLYAIPPQRLAYGSLYGVTYKIVPLGTLNSAYVRPTR